VEHDDKTPGPASAPAARGVKADGRRARSARTRLAIIEAFLDLIQKSHKVPTAAEIASHARCSTRSVFERFADFTELFSASFDYVIQQGVLTPIGDQATRDRRSRIEFHVGVRAANCERWLPLWRAVTRADIGSANMLKLRIAMVREMSMARLKLMYQPELQMLSPRQRQATLIALEALTDYESWGRMREQHGLSFAECCEVWIAMTDRLLPGPASKREGTSF